MEEGKHEEENEWRGERRKEERREGGRVKKELEGQNREGKKRKQ